LLIKASCPLTMSSMYFIIADFAVSVQSLCNVI